MRDEGEVFGCVFMTCHNFAVHGRRIWAFDRNEVFTDANTTEQEIKLWLKKGKEEHRLTHCSKEPLVSVVIGANTVRL